MKYILTLLFVLSFTLNYNCRNDGGLIGESLPQFENACMRVQPEPEFP